MANHSVFGGATITPFRQGVTRIHMLNTYINKKREHTPPKSLLNIKKNTKLKHCITGPTTLSHPLSRPKQPPHNRDSQCPPVPTQTPHPNIPCPAGIKEPTFPYLAPSNPHLDAPTVYCGQTSTVGNVPDQVQLLHGIQKPH